MSSVEQNDRDMAMRGNRMRSTPKSKKNRVYVANIPYLYKWTDMKDLFRDLVGDVAYVELFNDINDKPRGCGIVEFTKPEFVKKALEAANGYEIDGRKIIVKEDAGQERDKQGYVIKGNMKEDKQFDMRGMNFGNMPSMSNNMMLLDMESSQMEPMKTYGLSMQFLGNIGIDGPLLNRVFVGNLDYKVDKKKLKEVFKMAGNIYDIDLSVDKDGNSKGFALIEYGHPVEAVQAISLFDKQYLYERRISVRMDRVNHDKRDIRLPEGLRGIGPGLGANGAPLRTVANTIIQNMATPPQPPVNMPNIDMMNNSNFSNMSSSNANNSNFPSSNFGSNIGSNQNQMLPGLMSGNFNSNNAGTLFSGSTSMDLGRMNMSQMRNGGNSNQSNNIMTSPLPRDMFANYRKNSSSMMDRQKSSSKPLNYSSRDYKRN